MIIQRTDQVGTTETKVEEQTIRGKASAKRYNVSYLLKELEEDASAISVESSFQTFGIPIMKLNPYC